MEALNDILIKISCKLEGGVALSPSEQTIWEDWHRQHPIRDKIRITGEDIQEMAECQQEADILMDKFTREHFPEPLEDVELPLAIRRSKKRWLVLAAVVIFLLPVAYIIWQSSSEGPEQVKKQEVAESKKQEKPDSNHVYLTLADGTKILLNKEKKDTQLLQGDSLVARISNKTVEYQAGHEKQSEANLYNVIQVPRGEQFQLKLVDGTRVWLNAESSLRYPLFFADSNRRVELTGEAYFEVAKVPGKPFEVKVQDMTVEAIGTRFNIKAYPNSVRYETTLLGGEINVYKSGAKEKLNKIGQQVQAEGHVLRLVNDIIIEEAIAWKNEQFYYRNTELRTIMQDIERCYNVLVEYEGSVQPLYFRVSGISRSEPVTRLLKVLKRMEPALKFKYSEGEKIITVTAE